MITAKELNPKGYKLTPDQQHNQDKLHYKMCIFRYKYNKPMISTSGVRSHKEHIKIYEDLGVSFDKIPMGSNHLKAAAVDIRDTDGSLYKYCIENENLLRKLGLWIERDTDGWVHFQSEQYGSWRDGKSMFFYP